MGGSARVPTLCAEVSSCVTLQRSVSSTHTSSARARWYSTSVEGRAELKASQIECAVLREGRAADGQAAGAAGDGRCDGDRPRFRSPPRIIGERRRDKGL